MRKELLKGLTEEQIKKVEACKSSEEILNLAKAEGVELNEEQLAAVSVVAVVLHVSVQCVVLPTLKGRQRMRRLKQQRTMQKMEKFMFVKTVSTSGL